MKPDEVAWITENVAITNFLSAHSKDLLAEHRVQAILCLDRELQGDSPEARGVQCIQVVHLVDGANDMIAFTNAVNALEELIGKWQRVVVHRRAGRSRSIAVVAAYLKKAKDLNDRAEMCSDVRLPRRGFDSAAQGRGSAPYENRQSPLNSSGWSSNSAIRHEAKRSARTGR